MVFSIGAITVAAAETVSRTGTQMGNELRKPMYALPPGVPSRMSSKKCTMLVPTLSANSRCSHAHTLCKGTHLEEGAI